MEWILGVVLSAIAAGALGFTAGSFLNWGAQNMKNAIQSQKVRIRQLEGKIAELEGSGAVSGVEPAGSAGIDLGALGSVLEGSGDWKALIPIVLKNPELIKVGLQAIQGKLGEGQGSPPAPAAGAGRPPTNI